MKRFYCIGENEKEELDLISLFEYSSDYKLSYDEVVIMLSRLNKYVCINERK
jgi:hypothetical protein